MLEQLELDRRLQLALDALAFTQTTEVQDKVIPAALTGRDLMVSAETGSGKTLAYLVPMVQRLLCQEGPLDGPQGLILVPTRELARQVLKNCRARLGKTPLQVSGINGGDELRFQQSLFRTNPEIVVATPGRLLEHCERKSVDLGTLQADTPSSDAVQGVATLYSDAYHLIARDDAQILSFADLPGIWTLKNSNSDLSEEKTFSLSFATLAFSL